MAEDSDRTSSVQTIIAEESQEVLNSLDKAQKVLANVNGTVSDLREAITDLRNVRSNLEALQIACERLGEAENDAQTPHEAIKVDVSILKKQYEETAKLLEKRFVKFSEFDNVANNVGVRLKIMENNINEWEYAKENFQFTVFNELRKSVEEMGQWRGELTPLLKPIMIIEEFSNRLAAISETVERWISEDERLKLKLDAENRIFDMINDSERTIAYAEMDLENLHPKVIAVSNFRDKTLPMILEKLNYINELFESMTIGNIDQLLRKNDALRVRYENLARQMNGKLEYAKGQEVLEEKIDDIENEVDNLIIKYNVPQQLATAMENIEHFRSFLDLLQFAPHIRYITEQLFNEQLAKRAYALKKRIKMFLVDLQSDAKNEQELITSERIIHTSFASIAEAATSVQTYVEDPLKQLRIIERLSLKLQQLQVKAEGIDGRLKRTRKCLVKHSSTIINDDLFVRFGKLQKIFVNIRHHLRLRLMVNDIHVKIAKIREMASKVIGNRIPNRNLYFFELFELEVKRRHLEHLVDRIPPGDEFSDLRENCNQELQTLYGLLKRLSIAFREKQISLPELLTNPQEVGDAPPADHPARTFLTLSLVADMTLESYLYELHLSFRNLKNLRKIAQHLAEEQQTNTRMQKLPSLVDAMKTKIEMYGHEIEKGFVFLLSFRKLYDHGNYLCQELRDLTEEGHKMLVDNEAIPELYRPAYVRLTNVQWQATVLDRAAVLFIRLAPSMRTSTTRDLVRFVQMERQLSILCSNGRIIIDELLRRSVIWSQIVKLRDDATAQLEAKQNLLTEIKVKSIRSREEVAEDLEKLKNAKQELANLRDLLPKLTNLVKKLNSLEAVLHEVHFHFVTLQQIQQEFDHLILLINDELDDETFLNESVQNFVQEFERLESELFAAETASCEQPEKIDKEQLLQLKEQLQLIKSKYDEARQQRVHVTPMPQTPVETLIEQMNRICMVFCEELDYPVAEGENQEEIAISKRVSETLYISKRVPDTLREEENDENGQISKEKLEFKLFSLLKRLDGLRSLLKPIIEEEPERKKMKMDEYSLFVVDEQINILQSIHDQMTNEILPSMNELNSRSQEGGNIILSSLQAELNNAHNFAAKCKEKLNEKRAEKEQMQSMSSSQTQPEQ